ncbi:MAG: ribosomal L7Ae/L30e/S12e/Gadd45 family protein [Thermoanaerobacteraceae bacterium]|uniref:50S ribosomal protein L7Ae-like protein n=1 Tax=Desulfofundulus thermobenzoicus TaxID=29376 RepID=A0A6N7INJ6_9FIRM|nr:ribosomal L7Ae/L30e/S12e/Gadd45 family protein [Desulfofundulus thermobenzoicus]MBE3587515.1 ribosomal L7Ae/L30e/S12e/Gadd45 family protein [Thermoanaerobacteraceae bacterium]MQL50908.1 50S ribosomal protein L7Ae-like protein [Desulfofundulus thermobenzoicus]HHW42277.1 50S ribosomal protein L7Ae-like protein [Desulfotomaculum sp.]
MPLTRLYRARKKTVGSKQTLKAIQRGQAKVVYLALNAEKKVTDPIQEACLMKKVPVVQVETMLMLGRACGIEVGCASAAIIED